MTSPRSVETSVRGRSPLPHRDIFIAAGGIMLGALCSLVGLDIESGAIAILSMGPLFISLDRRFTPELLFGPLLFAYVYHAFGYSLGPLGQRYLANLGESYDSGGLMLAQWGAVLGLALYALVYSRVFAFIFRRFPTRDETGQRFDMASFDGYALTLLLASITLITVAYMAGASRLSEDAENLAPGLVTSILAFQYIHRIVFFFLGWSAARRGGRWMALWAIAFIVYSVFHAMEGSRGNVAIAAVLSAIGFVLGGFSRRRVLVFLVCMFIVFVPLSNTVVLYRTFYGHLYPTGIVDRVGAFLAAASDFNRMRQQGEASFLGALFEDMTARAVDRVMIMTPNSIPYVGFEGLDAIIYVWVPLQLYPDRPSFSDGNNAAAEYGIGFKDGVGPTGGRTFVYMPTVGEGYRRFGWAGIPVVYAFSGTIFGATAALAWAKRRRREWMAMMVWVLLNASAPWTLTLIAGSYLVLSTVPRYFALFLLLRFAHDGVRALLKAPRLRTPVERHAIIPR